MNGNPGRGNQTGADSASRQNNANGHKAVNGGWPKPPHRHCACGVDHPHSPLRLPAPQAQATSKSPRKSRENEHCRTARNLL